MIEERTQKLRKKLKYLVNTEIEKEIKENAQNLANEKINVSDIAKNIYLKRGIDYSKIKAFNIVDNINEMIDIFKNKDSKIRKKMYIDLIYIIILIILIKIPFDLVKDIGYDYIKILSTKPIYDSLWSMLFLLLYTLTSVCTLLILIRNFNSKYKDK